MATAGCRPRLLVWWLASGLNKLQKRTCRALCGAGRIKYANTCSAAKPRARERVRAASAEAQSSLRSKGSQPGEKRPPLMAPSTAATAADAPADSGAQGPATPPLVPRGPLENTIVMTRPVLDAGGAAADARQDRLAVFKARITALCSRARRRPRCGSLVGETRPIAWGPQEQMPPDPPAGG